MHIFKKLLRQRLSIFYFKDIRYDVKTDRAFDKDEYYTTKIPFKDGKAGGLAYLEKEDKGDFYR
jgi:hypothetical protein